MNYQVNELEEALTHLQSDWLERKQELSNRIEFYEKYIYTKIKHNKNINSELKNAMLNLIFNAYELINLLDNSKEIHQ